MRQSTAAPCGCGDCWSCQVKSAVQKEQEAADDADTRLRLAVHNLERSGERVGETAQKIAQERDSARITQRIPNLVGLEISAPHRIPAFLLLQAERERLEEEEEDLDFERLTLENEPHKT